MTVCVGVYKGGEVKMETDTYFMGLLIWLKKWERDESSSRRTEFFDVFKGGERSTSRPASKSWSDSDISLGRSLSQARYPSLRSATQTRRGVGRGDGGTNRLSRLLRPTPRAADKPRSLGKRNPLPGAVLGELTNELGDHTPRVMVGATSGSAVPGTSAKAPPSGGVGWWRGERP